MLSVSFTAVLIGSHDTECAVCQSTSRSRL